MKFENVTGYCDEEFCRITGVKRLTFEWMLEILSVALVKCLCVGGRKPKLSLEDMLLACLEYIRKYRTYAHVAASYGMSESQFFRICWVEDVLIKDGTFSLSGRKALLKSDVEYVGVLVDARVFGGVSETKQKRYYSGKKKRHTIKS
jgi:hypothetical protein